MKRRFQLHRGARWALAPGALALVLALLLSVMFVGDRGVPAPKAQAQPATGDIQIWKWTDPWWGTGFGFTDDIAAPNAFTLDDTQAATFINVPSGTYTVTENDPMVTPGGWDLTNIVCYDPDGGSSVNVVTRTASIDLDPGETVVCDFFNTQRGTIVIEKLTVPPGGAGFGFFEPTLGAFGLNDGGTVTFNNVPPGFYPVAEDDPQVTPGGFDLTDITCVDPDGGSGGNLGLRTAAIDLDPGETVTCTFTNTTGCLFEDPARGTTLGIADFTWFFVGPGVTATGDVWQRPGQYVTVLSREPGFILSAKGKCDSGPGSAIALNLFPLQLLMLFDFTP